MSTRNSTVKRRLRERLLNGRKEFRCCHCRGKYPAAKATLEHIVPLSEGGGWRVENLRLACFYCNTKRGSRDFREFQRETREAIGRATEKNDGNRC